MCLFLIISIYVKPFFLLFSLNQVNFIGQNTSKKCLKICPFEKLFKEKAKYTIILYNKENWE